ncbi:hypothetical protein [Streptomyces sp. ODS28]|uniref:hypothetical protein n=1 Tax=Streptomyces sp. ODS28 TaxID=3136688 RepID=UPI0031F0DB6F
MRTFKRAALLGATVVAATGLAVGGAQAAEQHETMTQGDYKKDCHTEQTQKENDMAQGAKTVIDKCTPDGPGSMVIHWHYA